MPVGEYFQGHGDEVMASMKKKYGEKKGKSVFYATDAKRKRKGKKKTVGAQAKAFS